MKTSLTLTALLFCAFTVTAADKIPGVKKLTLKKDGSYKVKCVNKSKGFISQEETNICVFSKENSKNRCDDQKKWTINDAAEFICQ